MPQLLKLGELNQEGIAEYIYICPKGIEAKVQLFVFEFLVRALI